MWVAVLFSQLLAFVFGCFLFRRGWPLWCKLILLECSLSTLVEWGTSYYSMITRKPNHWMFNIYIPMEAVLIIFIFYLAARVRIIRRLDLILLSVIPILLPIAFIILPDLYTMNVIMAAGVCVLIMIAACAACIGILLEREDQAVFYSPLFWWATGLLGYALCNCIYYITFFLARKMILFDFIAVIYLFGQFALSLGAAGCFIFSKSSAARSRQE